MPGAKRRARRRRRLVFGLILVGGGACQFFVGHTSPVAPASGGGVAASNIQAIPNASRVHAPVAAVAGLAEQTRAVVPNARVHPARPGYRPIIRFSFNSTSTIGLS